MVAKLKCVRAAATLLRDDGVRRVLTSKEESSNRRWHGVGNPRNRLLGNDARTTGHRRDKAQCRSAAANREHRLRGRINAADFDSWACLHGVCRSRLTQKVSDVAAKTPKRRQQNHRSTTQNRWPKPVASLHRLVRRHRSNESHMISRHPEAHLPPRRGKVKVAQGKGAQRLPPWETGQQQQQPL